MHGDPEVYAFDPDERHPDEEYTAGWLRPMIEHWDRFGFGAMSKDDSQAVCERTVIDKACIPAIAHAQMLAVPLVGGRQPNLELDFFLDAALYATERCRDSDGRARQGVVLDDVRG